MMGRRPCVPEPIYRRVVAALALALGVFMPLQISQKPSPEGEFAMRFLRRILATDAPAAVILIRLIVGGVFLSEGVQKFLYPEDLGVGRFAKIGIPAPEVMAPFVGVCEIICGVFFFLGLLTRFAAVTMIINMLVAISTTKVPMLHKDGFWKMAHEARTDYAMLLGSVFLLLVGAGSWSFDAWLGRRNQQKAG
jgi:putative oxidoreductase